MPETQTASFETGYKRGAPAQSVQAGLVDIDFSQAKYYSEVRCYAGSTITISGAPITKVVFGQGKEISTNVLTADKGQMVDSLTWEGNAMRIVFTVNGESGYRGFSSITVTYMVDTDDDDEVNYDQFLTACGDVPEPPEEGIETVSGERLVVRGKKILINGQLYIVIEDAMYNIIGQRVR